MAKNLRIIFNLHSEAAFVYNQSMGRKRLPQEMREYLARIGRKGGKVGGKRRLETMTDEQRRESARRAVTARWAKVRETQV